jgi:hypothetical protein
MNEEQAKRAVVLSLFAAGTVVVLSRSIKQGFPTDPRLYIAGAFIYIILGFAADFAPQVAGPFAILVFFAVLLYQGAPLFDGIVSALNQPRRKK